jgi:hypothetical protein
VQASSGASSSHDSIRYEGIHGLVYGDGKMLPPPRFASRTQSERVRRGVLTTRSVKPKPDSIFRRYQSRRSNVALEAPVTRF